ncbi:LuxR family transcriptional regulator [Sphingopyxis sp. MC1]|nr:LuxR family transcriptional regulator [Sphingopyxis sp. MC1]
MGQRIPPDWDDIFLEAALEPANWLGALDRMARHTGSSHGQLIGVGGARERPFNIVTNFGPDMIAKAQSNDWYGETTNFRIAVSNQHVAKGHYDPILHEAHYDAAVETLESRDYVDWCEEIGIPFGCQTNLVIDNFGIVGLATLRNRGDGRTTDDQRGIFAQAAAAARRAVRLQEKLEGQQAQLLAGAFDAISATAFILDARGNLLAHTLAAEALLQAGTVRQVGLSIDAGGAPHTLRALIQALIAEEGARHGRTMLATGDAAPSLMIEGFRLPERDWSLGKRPHAILVVNPPRRDRAGVTPFLSTLYRLSPAEADIALRLFEGKTRAQISDERGVTAETLRGQIKQIYQKCGVDGEAALMRLLAPIFA